MDVSESTPSHLSPCLGHSPQGRRALVMQKVFLGEPSAVEISSGEALDMDWDEEV